MIDIDKVLDLTRQGLIVWRKTSNRFWIEKYEAEYQGRHLVLEFDQEIDVIGRGTFQGDIEITLTIIDAFGSKTEYRLDKAWKNSQSSVRGELKLEELYNLIKAS